MSRRRLLAVRRLRRQDRFQDVNRHRHRDAFPAWAERPIRGAYWQLAEKVVKQVETRSAVKDWGAEQVDSWMAIARRKDETFHHRHDIHRRHLPDLRRHLLDHRLPHEQANRWR